MREKVGMIKREREEGWEGRREKGRKGGNEEGREKSLCHRMELPRAIDRQFERPSRINQVIPSNDFKQSGGG